MSKAAAVARALSLLGKRHLVLAIHDASFPGAYGEDLGRGSPYGRGGRYFLDFIAGLGFTGVQFGPQGQTTADNPSPYDSTIFARNPLSIDLLNLAEDPQWAGILRPEAVASLVRAPGKQVAHSEVHAGFTAALAEAAANLAHSPAHDPRAAALRERVAGFAAEHRPWLTHAALFHALAAAHGDDWRGWPAPLRDLSLDAPGDLLAALLRDHADAVAAYAAVQTIAHHQHNALRNYAHSLELTLFGDLQIGLAHSDVWARRHLFLSDYRMGAPPSRTNPAGQPWNYAVLDPHQYLTDGAPGPAARFLQARVDKLLAEFDGLRIDHPHGLVCPWVYRADREPLPAVQSGARLFESPDLPDHPELAAHAIARRDQLSLNPATPRHADEWVRSLDDAQVDRYAILIDVILAASAAHGRDRRDVLCEVLSTQPYPLRRVMQRHDLGRFRVTQKASLSDPHDVYRSENAAPADWIMVGNHDTPTIWELVHQTWPADGSLQARAERLAHRLAPEDHSVPAFARDLAADPGRLAQAMFADIFASPAQNVQIFHADLLGEQARYNLPGTVDAANWSLRVDPDYARRYPALRRERAALDLPAALAMALRRRGQPHTPERARALDELDALASA